MLIKKLKDLSKSVSRKLLEVEKEILKNPTNIEELNSVRIFVDQSLPKILEEIKKEKEEWIIINDLLESQRYKLSKDDLQKRWNIT